MTKIDRQQAIQDLINDQIDTVQQYLNMGDVDTYVDGIFRYGFKGFDDMSDEELIEEYENRLGEYIEIVG